MIEATKEKKPTAYKVFLAGDEGAWSEVGVLPAANARKALDALVEAAEETGTDASGDYMIVPQNNVTYLRPRLKVVKSYDMEEFVPEQCRPKHQS